MVAGYNIGNATALPDIIVVAGYNIGNATALPDIIVVALVIIQGILLHSLIS